MISTRSISSFFTKLPKSGLASRPFSTERFALTPNDVEIVKNPGNDQIDSFLRTVGDLKQDVKLADFKLMRETMGSNYNLFFLCRKDSSEVVSAGQAILYKSLKGEADFQSWGVLYNPPKYQKILEYLFKNMTEELGAAKMNSGGCAESTHVSLWHKYLHAKVRSVNFYKSQFDFKDIIIPDFDFENIVIKKIDNSTIRDVIAYDQTVFPYERSKYISAKFQKGDGRIATDKSGKVIGIGLVTIDSNGKCTLGPFYCDNKEAARAIFQNILSESPRDKIRSIQINSSNSFVESSNWASPFFRVPVEMTLQSYVKFNRVIPIGLDYSKVFVNSNPANAPC